MTQLIRIIEDNIGKRHYISKKYLHNFFLN